MNSDFIQPEYFSVPVSFRNEEIKTRAIPHMLTPSEMQLLKWFSSVVYQGKGAIVELGTWLGGSTMYLADGLRLNRSIAEKKIHCYDSFMWQKDPYESFITEACDPSIRSAMLEKEEWTSFLDIYKKVVAESIDLLEIHPGYIEEQEWNGSRIEILFVDLMKTESICSDVTLKFFPYLIPGQSYLIHQDFQHDYTWWIHLLMYRLRKAVLPVLGLYDGPSVVFTPVEKLNEDLLRYSSDFSCCTSEEIERAFDYSLEICRASQRWAIEQLRLARQNALQSLARRPS